MNNIVGRDKEKKLLKEAFNSSEAEFIAIYGRRRIGKTYLIRSFFTSQDCIYFQITGAFKASLKSQLERFAQEIGEVFYSGASIVIKNNWMHAFEELRLAIINTSENKKIVIFLDELPWLATRKSGVITAIEYFWNRYWSNDPRIKLIVCGSAASWIIKKIIRNRDGLHNRITKKIRLLPFDIGETKEYLKYIGYSCDKLSIAKLYMIMGGVPYYLKQLKKDKSIDQNIENLFIQSEGTFFYEFEEIFTSLFENSEQYQELVSLIAQYREGAPREILESKNKFTGRGGRLTARLADLEDAGFINSYVPYGHNIRGVYYRISDEYCFFYLKWISPIKNKLKQNKLTDYWLSKVGKPEYYNWLGYVFENLCYKHINLIKRALKIQNNSLASPWRFTPTKKTVEQGAQIDLLFERNDNAITVCEIKYTSQPYLIDKQYHEKLKQKINIFKKITRTNNQIFFALISANGVKENVYSQELVSSLVTIEDFFINSEV